MDRKKVAGLLFCCFVFGVILLSKVFTGSGVKSASLEPFNEFLKVPDNYRMLDFDRWEDGMSRTNLYSIKNSAVCVTEEDYTIVAKITDILNQKKFTPITKAEFDLSYSDSNDKVKFWLSTSADPELAKESFYPFNVFIYEDMSLYVEAIKSGDYRYLKDDVTEDEYKLIEQSYNNLSK